MKIAPALALSMALEATFWVRAYGDGLPEKFFDPHHHFFDTGLDWASYLNSLVGNITYFPEDYASAVIDPIKAAGVEYLGSVIVEGPPGKSYDVLCWKRGPLSW